MKKRTLGKDLKVSAVGLGCMGFTHAYGKPSDKTEATKAIREAAELGCTFFDTAECYIGQRGDGSTAYNEELVGNALKRIRSQVRIATKFGVRHEKRMLVMDSRPETIRCSIEQSLRRLQTDHVDLYYQHRIDPDIPAAEVAAIDNKLERMSMSAVFGGSSVREERG